MPSYNPNSIWGSQEKKYSYNPPGSPVPPKSSQPIPPEGPSFFHRHKLAFFTIGLLLAIGLVGLVFYLLLPAPAPNIKISFSSPDTIVLGQPFPLAITVSNESKSVLKNAQLDIILPNGLSFVGQDPTQRVMSEQIDTLSSQTINPPESVQIIATGNSATSQNITVKLGYETAETAGTQYETDANTTLVIGEQSAITINYTYSQSIFSGQNFDTVVNYQNNTNAALQDVKFTMQYPPAFNFIRSTLQPLDSSNATWDLGSLGANATGTFTITGNIVGPSGVQYQLAGTPTIKFSNQNYALNIPNANAEFLVIASPLSLSLSVNGSLSYIAKPGGTLNYTVTYTNNSNIAFQGTNISVALVGSMFDFSTVKTPGAFNSNTNTITWNAANAPDLLSVAPGQSGSVTFSVATRSSYPIRLPSDKNYTLKINAQIESPTVPENTAGTDTRSIASLTNKIAGSLVIAAKGYRRDPTVTITNSGPYPPVVNSATQYTIHWDITNYSTDAQNVTVSAYLQSGTTFTGQIKSNVVSSTPVYNSGTGQITWTIPLLPATTGVISSPAEAVFQVSNTPSIAQVGQSVTLLGTTDVTSTDVFTGMTVHTSDDAITTALPDDTSIGASASRAVTQ